MPSKSATIIGLGEVLWDVFPDGARFGGAAANFACTAKGLARDQLEVCMVSGVGDDDLGRKAISTLQEKGVDTSTVQISPRATGQVMVELDSEGKASYEFLDDTAWDNLAWADSLANLAPRADAVCFGTLGQRSARSRETIQRFLAAMPSEALRIFDINIRAPFYTRETILQSLGLANVLKLNDDELPILAELVDGCEGHLDVLRKLASQYQLRCVALTRGEQGAVLVRGEEVSDRPGVAAEVVDTVGAGDAFTAALAVGLLNGHDLDQINKRAAELAAYVCSQAGATPSIPERFWF